MKQMIPKFTLLIVQWSLSLSLSYATVDPCSVCNETDKNINLTGVRGKCYDEVGAWYELKGIDAPKECDDVEDWSTVTPKCKYTVFSMLNCIDKTYADPCNVCNENDKDINNSNVSDKCVDEVGAWYDLKGIDAPKECDDVENGSTVSPKCKYTIFSMLNCIDKTYADPCSVCNENDKNINLTGVRSKCYDEVVAWSDLNEKNGANTREIRRYSENCDGSENDSASTVSTICKYTVFSMLKCSINNADPCSVCNENDRNINLIGVSDKCYDEVDIWDDQNEIDVPKECYDSENDSASTVSAKCKYAWFSMLKCSINPCANDYGKFKYHNDIYSCKQLNRLKKKYRKKICMKEESARKLCPVICEK